MNFKHTVLIIILILSSTYITTIIIDDKYSHQTLEIKKATNLDLSIDRKNHSFRVEEKSDIEKRQVEVDEETQKKISEPNISNSEDNSIKMIDHLMISFKKGTEITQAGRKVLEKNLYPLLNNTSIKVMLTGHSDSMSSKQSSNLKLSVDRALKVKKELIELGINPKQIQTQGKGDSDPIDSENPSDSLNRRVHITIISMD